MWPRALEEIDKQLLVSQTELKGVGVEKRDVEGPARAARRNRVSSILPSKLALVKGQG